VIVTINDLHILSHGDKIYTYYIGRSHRMNQPFNSQSSLGNNNNEKQIIKAFVMTDSEVAGNIAYKTDIVDGVQMYEGLPIDMFHKIMELEIMKDKYTVEYTYSKEGESNYSDVVSRIGKGEYDIGIGVFNRNLEREQQVNFSAPFILDPNAIFHIETSSIVTLFHLMIKSIGHIILVLILLGIVSGLLIYFGNPGRMARLKIKTNRKFFLYSIIAGMSAMFGEMGLVADHATRSIKGLIIFFITMLTAFIFVLIAQARMTSALVDEKIGSKITKDNMPIQKLLGLKGYIPTNSIQEYGGRIEYVEDGTIDDIVTKYIETPDKYAGIALSYADGFKYLDKYPQLFVSLGFGVETGGYPINESKTNILEDVNNGIVFLENEGTLQNTCHFYYGDRENNPICSLR